ncbi:MAG: asparagine synthase (glutamine-hydrolyzing) [Ilumatobacteraceae bacterium]
MCGICGFFDTSHSTGAAQLEAMTLQLQHRGPDGSGTQLFNSPQGSLGLGHRRLSIIELSPLGKQPMAFEHLWVSFNGEIYNHAELRHELEQLGHRFISHSDTEVLLQAYARWGEAAINRFTGMFAFALYNSQTHNLLLCRDRAGVKPLFYYYHNGLLLFGSELKALTAHTAFKKQLNPQALEAYLQLGYVPAPHCIWQHTYKLPAGHYLHINLSQPLQHNTLIPQCYWDISHAYNKPVHNISYAEALHETEARLYKAFNYRMVADVPVGIFLSGGYDSSTVAALLQSRSHRPLKTFTIGVPDMGLNEAPQAAAIAKHLGTQHYSTNCTEAEALELIAQVPFYFDEPFGDSSALPTMLVSRLARQQVTVALSADAGDELFAGYNRYSYVMRLSGSLRQSPQSLRRILAALLRSKPLRHMPVLRHQPHYHHRLHKLQQLVDDPSARAFMWRLCSQYSDAELQGLMQQPAGLPPTLFNSHALNNSNDTLSYMLSLDYKTYLCDDILQKVDRATMHVSLEGREPFLDHELAEWVACLPGNFKYYRGQKKRLLKAINHKYLPESLMNQPKKGFAIPLARWLQNALKADVQQALGPKLPPQLNVQGVQAELQAFFAGHNERANRIWYLYMFSKWYERWA